jgi:hypothetical protein
MDIPNTIVAMVHDRVGGALAAFLSGGESPFFIQPSATLVAQLEDTTVTLPRVSAGLVGDIAVSSVSALLSRLRSVSGATGQGGVAGGPRLLNPELLAQVRDAIVGQLPFRPQQGQTNSGGAIESLVALLDRDPQDIAAGMQDFRNSLNTLLKGLVRPGSADDEANVGRLRQILGNDMHTIMPLAAIANAVKGLKNAADAPPSIEQGLLAYFFSSEGYRTVDGESVVAPVHLSDLKTIAAGAIDVSPGAGVKLNPASVKQQLRGLFTTATAEQYLRDTTRVIVESAYDAVRGLKDTNGAKGLYSVVTEELRTRNKARADREAIVDKFVVWFRGFSSMAESAAMRAVEVGTQGVSEFQTNPLIAAAAGAFAGTVARKVAQDSFLAVLSKELKQ